MFVPEGLTPAKLEDLYLTELKTESEIATQFGTYQVHICRLRKEWGIPTLGKTCRMALALPVLSPYQEEILIGSLLGDGGMNCTSESSARFNEGHCLKQAEYSNWKAQVLSPFVRWLGNRDKTCKKTGRVFTSHCFSTHACPQLRPLYDLFYPAPDRRKVFPVDLHLRMTPLALAIWYMDDGSTGPRISFGLGSVSLDRAFVALRTLGLQPVYYPGDGSIHFPKQGFEFKSLVEPHMRPISCMAYKIPHETARQVGDRNARKFLAEDAKIKYEGGFSKKQLAKMFGVGVSTVSRRLKLAGAQMRRSGPVSKIL